MLHTKIAASQTKEALQPRPHCHPCCQRLTDINCMTPAHPQLCYPSRCLPLNHTLLSSNHPNKLTSSANLCEQHSIILEAMSSCCNVVSVLGRMIFTKRHIFFLELPFLHTLHIFLFNISLMMSVTEVTHVRFCKVLFVSSIIF